jgi:hypothetical protein
MSHGQEYINDVIQLAVKLQTINNKLPETLLIGGKQIWLEILKTFNLLIEIHVNILLLSKFF